MNFGLFQLRLQNLHPGRRRSGAPNDAPLIQPEHGLHLNTGIVKDMRLVGETHRPRCIHKASAVPPAESVLWHVVATLGDTQANAVHMQFHIAERGVNQVNVIPGRLGTSEDRKDTMACQSAFENETLAPGDQAPAVNNRLAPRSNSGASGLLGIDSPCDGVRIDDVRAFKPECSGESAFAGTIGTGDQGQSGHVRRRLDGVPAALRDGFRGDAMDPDGPRTACRQGTLPRICPRCRRRPQIAPRKVQSVERSRLLVRRPRRTQRSGYWHGPYTLSISHSRLPLGGSLAKETL